MMRFSSMLLGAALALWVVGPASGAATRGTQVWLSGSDVHGKRFDLSSLRGQVVAVTFTSRYTQGEAHKINKALSTRAGSSFAIVTVVDLIGVPSLFHGYAKRRIADEEQRGPVHHLLDEDGHIRQSFDAQPDRHVDIVVVDKDGSLRGRFRGVQHLGEAEALIDELCGTAVSTRR